jgi:serine/threonine protein kinase
MQSASSPPPQPPEHLGKGTYGTVSRGTDPKTGKPVAVKHIKADVFSHNNVDEKRIYREIKLLQMLEGHPNIVAVKYLTTSATSPENLKGVDIGLEEYKINLSELYRIKQTRPITELDVQNLFYQLLCGINFIHSARVVHRDLKSANILIKN